MSSPVKPIPDGYQSVIPYLVVSDARAQIDFMKQAFGAAELLRMENPDGTIGHTELRVGDSVVMLSQAGKSCAAMPCMMYLYVPDTDAAYERALAAGAKSVREPSTQFYGDRTAGVADRCGNQWWFGTHVEDVSPEELQRRHLAMKSGH